MYIRNPNQEFNQTFADSPTQPLRTAYQPTIDRIAYTKFFSTRMTIYINQLPNWNSDTSFLKYPPAEFIHSYNASSTDLEISAAGKWSLGRFYDDYWYWIGFNSSDNFEMIKWGPLSGTPSKTILNTETKYIKSAASYVELDWKGNIFFLLHEPHTSSSNNYSGLWKYDISTDTISTIAEDFMEEDSSESSEAAEGLGIDDTYAYCLHGPLANVTNKLKRIKISDGTVSNLSDPSISFWNCFVGPGIAYDLSTNPEAEDVINGIHWSGLTGFDVSDHLFLIGDSYPKTLYRTNSAEKIILYDDGSKSSITSFEYSGKPSAAASDEIYTDLPLYYPSIDEFNSGKHSFVFSDTLGVRAIGIS